MVLLQRQILSTVCLFVCVVMVTSLDFKPCSISSKLRYPWGMYISQDGDSFTHAYDMSFVSNAMSDFQLEAFPNLVYYCFRKSGSYYTFRSQETTLFGDYKIYIYFCWYFKKVSSSIYNIEEMTDPVVVGSDDHAKAYLKDTATPSSTDICQRKYSSKVGLTAPYKQIRKIIIATWGR